jgi:multicomponent Na+:H+ antiporter subunit C
MEALIAPVVGILFAIGLYLLLQGDLIKLVFGISILSNAANLLIFSCGRLTRGTPPIIPQQESSLSTAFANPLPEALILTAIVISFGLLAFLAALSYRSHRDFGSLSPDIQGDQDTP